MKIKDISQPKKLTISGFALPYLVIILFTAIIISLPGTTDDKWSKVGFMAFAIPFVAAFIGAILVGIGSVEKQKLDVRKKSLVHAFIFGFLWTTLFHFFITIYIFMQIVYSYAGGLKH